MTGRSRIRRRLVVVLVRRQRLQQGANRSVSREPLLRREIPERLTNRLLEETLLAERQRV